MTVVMRVPPVRYQSYTPQNRAAPPISKTSEPGKQSGRLVPRFPSGAARAAFRAPSPAGSPLHLGPGFVPYSKPPRRPGTPAVGPGRTHWPVACRPLGQRTGPAGQRLRV